MKFNDFMFLFYRASYTMESASPERAVNYICRNGVLLNRAHRTDEIHYTFDVDYVNNKRLLELDGQKQGYTLTLENAGGIIPLFFKIKKRIFFTAGLLAALLLLIYLTGHIWTIDIKGVEFADVDYARECLERAGFCEGVSKSSINVRSIQNEVLKNTDRFSWIWIYIKGTHAVVKVKKATPIPPIEDRYDYTDIVASCDGIILDIMPKKGRQMISVGDAVRKGDLLISGISETKYGPIRFLNASGRVWALTYHTLEGEFNHTCEKEYLSGKSATDITLNAFGKKINIKNNGKNKYKFYKIQEKVHKNLLFDKISLPISFTTRQYCEIIKEYEEISDKQVIDAARKRLSADIKSQLADGTKIFDITDEYKKLEGGNLYIKVTVVCKENIACPSKIIKPDLTREEN